MRLAARHDDGRQVVGEDLASQFAEVLSQLDAAECWSGLSGREQDRWLCWISTPRTPPKVSMYEAAHRLATGKPRPGRVHAPVSWVRATLHDLGFS